MLPLSGREQHTKNELILLPSCRKETVINVRELGCGMLLAIDVAALLGLGFLGKCNQGHYLTRSCVSASATGTQPGRVSADLHRNSICQPGRNDISKMAFQAPGSSVRLAGGTNRKEKTPTMPPGKTGVHYR